MKKRLEQGSLLDDPRILLKEPSFFLSWLFYNVILLLGGMGALGCFFTAFQIPLSWTPLFAAALFSSLFASALCLIRKFALPMGLLWTVVWICTLYFFYEDMAQGVLYAGNLVLSAWGEKLNYPLPQFAVSPECLQDPVHYCTTFACLLTVPVFFLLAFLYLSLKSSLGAFLLTGFFLLCPMAFSILPQTWSLSMLLLFWIFLLFTASSLGQKRHLIQRRRGFSASGSPAVRLSTLWILPAAALCMALISAAFPEESYERPQVVSDLRNGLQNGFGLSAMFKGGTGTSTDRVDLSALGERKYTGETVLQVKHNWSPQSEGNPNTAQNLQKDYLKSFAGSVYTGSSWERLSAEDSNELKEILAPEEAFSLPWAFSARMPTSAIDTGQTYDLAVKNCKANPRCLYLPYGITADSLEELPGKAWDDGFITSSNWLSGTQEYSLQGIGLPEGWDYSVRIGGYVSKHASDRFPYDMESILIPSADWEKALRPGGEYASLLEGTPEALDFSRKAAAYNSFVQEHYTQLPENVAGFLREYLRERGAPDHPAAATGHQLVFQNVDGFYYVYDAFNDAFNWIRLLFQTEYAYDLAPPPIPQGEDFVTYFLSESKEGYCVHFATAATAILRFWGVPARYAEGYAVPAGGLAKSSQWIDVPDRNAHAWVEVYYSGVGWLPFEVTPANPDAPAAYADALPHQENTPDPQATPSPTPRPTPRAATPTPPSAPTPTPARDAPAAPAEKSGPEIPWAALFVPLGTLFVLFLFWLNRFLHKKHRERAFSQKDKSQAGLSAYAHLLKLVPRVKLLPSFRGEIPKEWEELALKARFSGRPLTEEELHALTSACRDLEKRLKTELPLPKKLWAEYFYGLF